MTPQPPGQPGTAPPSSAALWHGRWQRFSAATVRAFHAYANWLVSISWRRFIVLALGLLIVVAIVHDMPPFTWTITERVESQPPRVVFMPPPTPTAPAPPAAPNAPRGPEVSMPGIHIESPDKDQGVEINIGKDGIRITPKVTRRADAASAAADAARTAASAAQSAASAALQGLHITLPPGEASDSVREAVDEAKRQIEASIRQAHEDAAQANRDAAQAREDAAQAISELTQAQRQPTTRITRVGIGDVMMQFTLLWIIASAIIKITYKGQIQAEAQGRAGHRDGRGRVAEAPGGRGAHGGDAGAGGAALPVQHAGLDRPPDRDRPGARQHDAEEPDRAAARQRCRRCARPATAAPRDLGRELAVIRPYLEILKVRMEERLTTEIDVPDGLLSAEFPSMMIQTPGRERHQARPGAQARGRHADA